MQRLAVTVGPDLEPVLVEDMTLEQAREAVHVLAAELDRERRAHLRTLERWRAFLQRRRGALPVSPAALQ